MTLEQMNEYLAKRGFLVERVYNPKSREYRFVIEKNGHSVGDLFTWPITSDWAARGREQKQFLDNLIHIFEESEENKMNYNFKVKSVEVSQEPGSDQIVIVTLKGPYNRTITPRTIGDLTHDIEGRINGSWQDRVNYVPYSQMTRSRVSPFDITRVIHNDPATIVFWADGTKTVVKCQPDDIYDPEKGLAMAISKKALGNQGNYCNVFKKWLPEEEPCEGPEMISRLETLMKAARHILAAKVLLTDSGDPTMYHPITEHYGYVLGPDEEWPYIVCHKDEAHLTRNPNHYECFFKTREFQNVKAECTNLEPRHYPEASDT